ncbi:hypothetical protein C7S14_0475 [Burkholderia cepacia]|nr:hypothetical protein C7S14_0475 [Burkholderia cepacia]
MSDERTIQPAMFRQIFLRPASFSAHAAKINCKYFTGRK